METIMLCVTVFGIIVLPIAGWIFKLVIEEKMKDLATQQKEDKILLFKKYDEMKETYVRKDMCDQSMTFHQKETDVKFENLLDKMNDKFRAVEDKIEDLKILIVKQFTTQQNQR